MGSFIEISINGNKQYRYTVAGEGYLSQNSNTEFFGLADNSVIDYVKVN
ncbi:ASPIC/UnbV domain-containing protein [Psychroserpens jangbogonensis]